MSASSSSSGFGLFTGMLLGFVAAAGMGRCSGLAAVLVNGSEAFVDLVCLKVLADADDFVVVVVEVRCGLAAGVREATF